MIERCVALAIATVVFSYCPAEGEIMTSKGEVALLVEKLSDDRQVGLALVEDIYEAGPDAVKVLAGALGDKRPFHGACGRLALESTYALEEVRSEGSADEEVLCPAVRDVALYLILAIARKDLFFAEECILKSGDLAESEIDAVFSEIQSALSEPSVIKQPKVLATHIQGVLRLFKLQFPGVVKHVEPGSDG